MPTCNIANHMSIPTRRNPKTFLLLGLITLFICGHILSSCHHTKGNTVTLSTENDSTSLKIALLPIEECNILRLAKENGQADSMKLNLEFISYDAMMDIDTAIISNVAHIYFSDSLRICRIKEDSLRPTLLLPVPTRFSLIANAEKKIDSIADLHTRMVGVTRWSQLEEHLLSLADSTAVNQNEIYHAQINSIPLRFRMITDGLLDAAIIPQPWADSLSAMGHNTLRDTVLCGMGFYISPVALRDSTHSRQAQILRKLYAKVMNTYKAY